MGRAGLRWGDMHYAVASAQLEMAANRLVEFLTFELHENGNEAILKATDNFY